MTIGLSVGALLFTVMLVILMSGGSASSSSYLIFLPMMLVTYLATGLTYWSSRRKFTRDLATAKEAYGQSLHSAEARLQSLMRKQRTLLLAGHVESAECLRRALKRDPRLGERRPEDPDFLSLRLGIGTVPSSYTIKEVTNPRPHEFEKELEEADRLYQEYSKVSAAPVAARLVPSGSIGIAGARLEVLGVARALLGQITTHHWPAEVQIGVICNSTAATEWEWISGLPHNTICAAWDLGRHGADELPSSESMKMLEEELLRRTQSVETMRRIAGSDHEVTTLLPHLILVFDYLPASYNHPGLSLLLENGAKLGVHGIFLTQKAELVPGMCGALITVQQDQLTYQETGPAGTTLTCRPDKLPSSQAAALFHALRTIDWPQAEDLSQPPAHVSLLQMLGGSNVDELPIEKWWTGEPPYGHLRAPIGKTSATADLIFDLNDRDGAHGPHGVLGGMTGSGKSEVLKAVILALAATHNPRDLNFALIDFKGGAAFNELAKLPHTVGVVTDIETHASYAERVILALSGEIERRKRILETARQRFAFGRSHIDEYRKLRVKQPLPRLVIVFDEFAEFKQRHPEESRRLISIARLGRSLGVHLILATQNIQAAIDPEILQNSTFRICLRVSEPQDSVQLVGIPNAVNLTRGRAYFSAQSRHLFQAAYTGGEHLHQKDPIPEVVVKVWPDGRRERIPGRLTSQGDHPQTTEVPVTEAQALVARLTRAARSLQLRKSPAVWPDPLLTWLCLPDVLKENVVGGWDGTAWHPCQSWWTGQDGDTGAHAFLGLIDEPAKQKQLALEVDPSQGGGHLLVFGSAASGKSTMLRSLVTSLALTHRPDEVWIYVLDFGGQSSLKVLETFPHVGAVVTRFETERAERLVQFIHAQVAARNDQFRMARVDRLADFNSKAPDGRRLPALYLVIDDFAGFKTAFSESPELVKSVSALVSGGSAVGLHLAIAASLPDDVPIDLFANLGLRLTFHQADQTEYFRIVGQPSDAKLKEDASRVPPPGRGLVRGTPPLEFQAALPTSGTSNKEQSEGLAELGEKMMKAWGGPTPPHIRSLPFLIELPSQLSAEFAAVDPYSSLVATLGLDNEGLAPVGLSLRDDGPTFLVAGSHPQSGKTCFIQMWTVALCERYPPNKVQFIFLDFHSRSLNALKRVPHRLEYVGTKSALETALTQLSSEMRRRGELLEKSFEANPNSFDPRSFLSDLPQIAVVIDDYETFAAKVSENDRQLLADCLRKGEELGLSLIVAGDASKLPREYGDTSILGQVRQQGCGVLLSGSDGVDQFNNAQIPSLQRAAGMPPGRGYLIRRGRARLFQAYIYWASGEDPVQGLQRRLDAIVASVPQGLSVSWPPS